MKLGTWIKADRVRIVKKNGRRVLEVQRAVKRKRKPATKKRKVRKAKAKKRKR